ncbi:MAG TPA: hypothetical protein VME20_00170 [Acidimicrobiales bacterium]|nr:hypothetical protein [Acidimicrobiales bacterium]
MGTSGATVRSVLAALTALGAAVGLASAPTTAAAAPKVSAACTTMADVIEIVGGSVASADEQSEGWVPISANGWTAFVPNGEWTITASDSGADVNSPDGQQDASLVTRYSLGVPWTFQTLGTNVVGHLTRVDVLCQETGAREASGQSKAEELTGYLGSEELRAVLILSMLTPTTETYVGEERYVYTPASQWSAANAKTLALIIRRSIEAPQSLG